MTLQNHVLSYFDELETLKEMSVDANKAFMDTLVLAVVADREITDQEIEQLDEELLRLPFIWDEEARDEVTEHSATTRKLIEENRDDPGVMEGFLDSLAKRIQEPDHRMVALRMFAAVAHSDGLTEEERQLALALGEAFGFEAGVVDQVMGEIAEAL